MSCILKVIFQSTDVKSDFKVWLCKDPVRFFSSKFILLPFWWIFVFSFIFYPNLYHWFFSTLLVKRVSEMAQKTMNIRSEWNNGLFERSNGLTSCIFFSRVKRVKKMQRVRPFGLEKRPFFHEDLAFIVLSANSIMSISNNVEHECL